MCGGCGDRRGVRKDIKREAEGMQDVRGEVTQWRGREEGRKECKE